MPASTSLPPSDYVVRKDVFVLDPHTLRDKGGKTLVNVDESMLAKIAANQNKRIAETGDATPLVIGHTRDGEREGEAPELVGYATDWKLQKFYKTGKRALSCTFHIFKKAADRVRKFPRRSVELWLDSLTIDPISLLGATTPERDLGLLRLSKQSSGSKLVATHDDSGELTVDDNTQQVVDAVLEAIKSTDVWQYMTQKMQQEGSDAESSAGAGDDSPLGGPGGGGEYDPQGEQGLLDALGGAGGADAGGVPGGDEEPMQMAAGAPGGGNTFAPGMGGMGGMDAEKPNRYSKISFQKLARENEDMKSTLNTLLMRYQRSEREKELIKLESEGYMLDRDEELNLCGNLDNNQFQQHVQRVRLRYQRAPMGAQPYMEQTAHVNRGRSMEDAKSVAEYAFNHGLSYEAALERMNGSKSVTY